MKKKNINFPLYRPYTINNEVFTVGSEIKEWVQLFSRIFFFVLKRILKTSWSVLMYNIDDLCQPPFLCHFRCCLFALSLWPETLLRPSHHYDHFHSDIPTTQQRTAFHPHHSYWPPTPSFFFVPRYDKSWNLMGVPGLPSHYVRWS